MLVFITHPKYFDRRKIRGKKPDLVYVFNSESTFKKFDEKCVNIGLDGKIKNENFFSKEFLDFNKGAVLDLKMSMYVYFKKVSLQHKRKFYVIRGGYKDYQYNLVKSMSKDIAKTDINRSIAFIDNEIVSVMFEILSLYYDKKDINKIYISKLYHIYDSFFRTYIYSLGFKRGAEIFGDVFKYSLFLNTFIYYKFDKFDVYREFFHFNYLKVLSRLFIEKIHKSNVKLMVEHNINYYKESGWLS